MKINGAGSIEKRGKNTWRIRFNLGADPVSGAYLYAPWRTVHGVKADAVAALADYRAEIEGGIKVDTDKITFAEFAELFNSQRKDRGTYSPSTIRDSAYQIKHLNTYIGSLSLKEIDALTINRLLAKFGAEGHSPAAVKRLYATLRQIMREALMQDIILTNPCEKIITPKKPKVPINFLDGKDAARLVAALEEVEQEAAALDASRRQTKPRKEHNYEKGKVRAAHKRAEAMAARIALATGSRRGEVLGLIWAYIDLDNQTVRIAQQMTKDGIRQPKTDRGSRVVSLDSGTVERLRIWKTQQAEYLEHIGIKQGSSTPVISNEVGGFSEPDGFSQWWRKFCKAHDFEGLRFHDLRHTQATLLIAQGVDIKTVQTRLGHTLASTTLDLYAGVIPAKDREAADIVGGLLDISNQATK